MDKKAKTPRSLHHRLANKRGGGGWGIWAIGGFAIIIVPAVAAVLWSGTWFAGTDTGGTAADQRAVVKEPLAEPPAPSWQRALDGVAVPSESLARSPLLALSVDNMIEARPQSGIGQALWVFEFPAEATITRWLGIFSSGQTDGGPIGPVRSLRPYMAELARSLGAVSVFSGGSPDALKLVGRFPKDYPSINEFANAPLFWRDRARPGPHNLYTSVAQLSAHSLVTQPSAKSGLQPLRWKDADAGAFNPDGTNKTLTIGYPEPYTARWRYGAMKRQFERIDANGNLQPLDDGKSITAQTVVVQFTDIRILDAIGRRSIRLTGSGDAMVFEGGRVELGQWTRPNATQRLQLIGADGQPIPLAPGRVWWTIVPKATEVKFE